MKSWRYCYTLFGLVFYCNAASLQINITLIKFQFNLQKNETPLNETSQLNVGFIQHIIAIS